LLLRLSYSMTESARADCGKTVATSVGGAVAVIIHKIHTGSLNRG